MTSSLSSLVSLLAGVVLGPFLWSSKHRVIDRHHIGHLSGALFGRLSAHFRLERCVSEKGQGWQGHSITKIACGLPIHFFDTAADFNVRFIQTNPIHDGEGYRSG